MRKNIQPNRILICVVLALIVSVAAPAQPAYTAGPPNIITNPNFTTNLTPWSNIGPYNWIWISNGNVFASLPAGFDEADLSQCINVNSTPTGNDWFIDVTGTSSSASGSLSIDLFDAKDCTGNQIDMTLEVGFNAGPVDYAYSQSPLSVRVILMCIAQGPFYPGTCTANSVSVGGPLATPIQLLDLQAKQAAPWERIYAWLRGLIWR